MEIEYMMPSILSFAKVCVVCFTVLVMWHTYLLANERAARRKSNERAARRKPFRDPNWQEREPE